MRPFPPRFNPGMSGAGRGSDSGHTNDDVTVTAEQNDVECDNVNENCDDATDGRGVPTSDCSLSSSSEVAQEQRDDLSLTGCWKLSDKSRAGFVVKDNLLYHRTRILGQDVYQLVVPESRRAHVLKMGHDSFGGHMGFKRTKARISCTFYWPGLREDCEQYVKTCEACLMKARVTYRDWIPIKPTPRGPPTLPKDSWCDKESPISVGKDARDYLRDSTPIWRMPRHMHKESVLQDLPCSVNTCAVACENGSQFGYIAVIPLSTEVSSPARPSHMIDRTSINHLGTEQRAELLAVLDRYPECFPMRRG